MSNKVGFISGLAVGSFDADDSFATIDLVDGNGASVSHAGHARLRFNLSTQQLEQSINTGAWIGIATGSSAGSSLAKYIIQTADASLPNAQTLSTLGTGLVKNTTGTGVLSIAIANTDFPAVSAQYIVATGTAAPPNAQNLGILTSGILKQSVSGGIATISIAVPGIDFANRVPQPGEFWIACVDQDGLTLSGNDTTGAIGIASPGQQTRVVTVTGADSAVASTKTLHFTSGGFTTNDLYGELVIGNAANAGSYRIKTVSSPTDVIVDGTIVNETFSGSVTLTVIGGPKATRDAALAAAKLTPFKTLDRLGAVLPRFGNAASLVVLARVRSGGAAYTLADLTGPSDMTWSRNLSGWAMVFFRPTDNFVNDLDDKIRSGYQILPGTNAGGYVATAGATVSNIPCQLVGGGAASIPAEVFTPGSGGVGGVIGYRLRFLSTTPTVALRNYAIMIHRSTTSSVVPAKDLPAVPLPNTDPSGGDKFVIEQTAFWVFDGTLDLGINRRVTFIGVGSTGTVGQISVECSTPTGSVASFMGWEVQPAVHFGFSATNNNSVIVSEIASDEMGGYLPSQGGLITAIQIGVGYRARLDNFNQNGLTVKSSCDISDTPRTWSGSRGTHRIGPGCVFKSGVTWISSDNGLNTWGESSSESVDTISAELGSQVSSFGSDSLPGYRRTRIAAPFVSYCIGVVGGALRVRGIEIDSASASVVSIGGIGTKVVIDDIIGTGGTIVGPIIDTSTLTVTTPAYGCLAVIGTRVPITVSGTVGDIKLVDGTIVPFTTLSSIFVEDLNNNRFVGTAGFAHLATSVTGRSLNSNGKIIDIQATASGQFLRRDGNNILGFGAITTADLPATIQQTTDTAVANLAELALVPVTNFSTKDRPSRFVNTVKDSFYLDKTSTLTTDGITVIAALGGTGRWIRLNISSLYWAAQATWYVDPINGNDENEGDTPGVGNALKTRSEYARRTDDMQLVSNVVINITSDLLATDKLLPHRWQTSTDAATGFKIRYQGTKIPLFTGTLGGVVNRVGSTATTTKLTLPSLPVSWTASGLVGKIVEGVNGSGHLVSAVVVADLGSKTAWVSPPENATFVGEDTFADLTSVTVYDCVNLTTGGSTTTQTLAYQYAEISYCKANRWEYSGNYATFTNCMGLMLTTGPQVRLENCNMTVSVQSGHLFVYGGSNLLAGNLGTVINYVFPATTGIQLVGSVSSAWIASSDLEINAPATSTGLIRAFNSGCRYIFNGYVYGTLVGGTNIVQFESGVRDCFVQFAKIPSFGSATGVNFIEAGVVASTATLAIKQLDDGFYNRVIGPAGPTLNDNASQPVAHLGSGGTTLTNAANIGDIHTTVSGIIGRVSNSIALTNIVVSGVEESIQFVETYKDFFHFDRHTTRTFQPDVVISGSQPNTWWVRMNIADPYWATVSNWYIDPAGTNSTPGNDEADGLTTNSPIKSIAEWRRRVNGAVYNATGPIIHALSGSTNPDDGLFTGFSTKNDAPASWVRVIGVPVTTGLSGTVGSYVAYSGNTRGQFTDTGIPVSWTASGAISSPSGSRWVRKVGSGSRHYAPLLKDLGAKAVQFGHVVDFDETDVVGFTTGAETNFANGDNYEVVSFLAWPVAEAMAGSVLFQCLEISTALSSPSFSQSYGNAINLYYRVCGFPVNVEFFGGGGQTVIYSAVFCMASPSGVAFASNALFVTNSSVVNSAIEFSFGAFALSTTSMIVVSSEIRFFHCAIAGSLGNMRYFDCATALVNVRHASSVKAAVSIVGSNNTGPLVNCDTSGIFYGASLITATTSKVLPYTVNSVDYATPVVDLSTGDGIY